MSLTKFTEDTNVISELDDTPSLTASQLKAKFDQVGTAIKGYINNTLTGEVEQLVATEKSTLQSLITALGTQIRSEISSGVQARYPVGKIIMDTENVNPVTYLGFGTWELWGQGKVPVGVNSEDEDFDEAEKTGGEKTHTLTVDEIPSHNHTLKFSTSGAPQLSGEYGAYLLAGNNPTAIANAGGGQAHNNLQPYITCYMWKRVS